MFSTFTMLFREVFADICMVRTLDLDSNTYFNEFYSDISMNPSSEDFYAVRIYITLTALQKDMPQKSQFPDANEFFIKLNRLAQKDPMQNLESLPLGCILKLQEYSKSCVKKLEELLNDKDVKTKVDKLREMYNNLIGLNVKYQDLQIFIRDYRKKYLNI